MFQDSFGSISRFWQYFKIFENISRFLKIFQDFFCNISIVWKDFKIFVGISRFSCNISRFWFCNISNHTQVQNPGFNTGILYYIEELAGAHSNWKFLYPLRSFWGYSEFILKKCLVTRTEFEGKNFEQPPNPEFRS